MVHCACAYACVSTAWRTARVHLDGRRHHAHDLGVPRRQVHPDVFEEAPHEVLVRPMLPRQETHSVLDAAAGKRGEGREGRWGAGGAEERGGAGRTGGARRAGGA